MVWGVKRRRAQGLWDLLRTAGALDDYGGLSPFGGATVVEYSIFMNHEI